MDTVSGRAHLAAYRAEIRTRRGRLICDISDLLDDAAIASADVSELIARRIADSLRQARRERRPSRPAASGPKPL
jgi:hypothetical protein